MDSYLLLKNTKWILFHTKGDKPKSYIEVLYDYISKYNNEKEHIWEPFIYKFYKDDYKPLEYAYAINNDNGLYLLTNLNNKCIYEINTVKDCFNSDVPNLYNIREIGFIVEDKNLNIV